MAPIATPIAERFHQRYEKIPEAGCWIWLGAPRFKGGYGQICQGKVPFGAHRVSWTLHNGPIPDGLSVLHRCDTPLCVNPDHLFLGTAADNNRDRENKGRGVQPRGELQGGHKLTEAKVAHLRGLPWLPIRVAKRLSVEWGVRVTHLYDVRAGREWLGAICG